MKSVKLKRIISCILFATLLLGAIVKCADLLEYKEARKKYTVVNGRFCPQSVRSFCPVVAGFNAGTYKVPACVL